MATIGKVRAVFTASTSGLTSGVNQAAASMRRMEASISSLRSGMGALVAIQGAQLFGSIASAAGGYIRSLVGMGQAQAEVIDQQSKLAARVGMTYGEFAGLALAGDLAGVGMDTVANAATRADVAFIKAKNGSAQAQKAFAGLGLSVAELSSMSPAERFTAIAQAIANLPTEAERAAAAVQVFGRAGMQLLPLFNGGADAIAEAANQAQRLGLALTSAQGRDVEAMNDAITLAYKGIQGIVQQVVAYLSPAVKAVADTFTKLIMDVGGTNIGRFIGDGILEGARFLAGIADWMIANLSGVWQYVMSVGQFWLGTVVGGMQRVAQGLYGVGRFIFGVFQSVAGLILQIVGRLANAVGEIAQKIPGLGASGRGLEAFGESVMASAYSMQQEAGNNILGGAGDAFDAIVGNAAESAGQAIAGPVTTALDAAIAHANESFAATDEAVSQSAAASTAAAETAVSQAQRVVTSAEALKAVDSRSADGINEMFRFQRETATVQEQQLSVLQDINSNIEDLDLGGFEVDDLAPAAGG